jgi:chorismate synthase
MAGGQSVSANTLGSLFQIVSFGESHGHSMGVVIDGCPAGVVFDKDLLLAELQRRRPGQSNTVSGRKESDLPKVLSGVFEGRTLGTPIAIVVKNKDAKSEDYEDIKNQPRTGHADDTWRLKFGHSDHRGGGRSSGRETIARVMAGAVAQMFLQSEMPGLELSVFATQVGPYELSEKEIAKFGKQMTSKSHLDNLPARFPYSDPAAVEKLLLDAKQEGKSYGGRVRIHMDGVPAGIGEPVFHKIKSELASVFMSLGAVAAVELGDGVSASKAEGSEYHKSDQGQYGGIRGGISTGERITLNCYFKPTSSVMDVAKKGRHDPCIVPRAIPVIEAMTYLVLADLALKRRLNRA